METSNMDWARLDLSLLSWCQTVHSINMATVYAITAPENQIDCVEDVGPTDVMWRSWERKADNENRKWLDRSDGAIETTRPIVGSVVEERLWEIMSNRGGIPDML